MFYRDVAYIMVHMIMPQSHLEKVFPEYANKIKTQTRLTQVILAIVKKQREVIFSIKKLKMKHLIILEMKIVSLIIMNYMKKSNCHI